MQNLQMDDIHAPLSMSMFPTMFSSYYDIYYYPLKTHALTTWIITKISLIFNSI